MRTVLIEILLAIIILGLWGDKILGFLLAIFSSILTLFLSLVSKENLEFAVGFAILLVFLGVVVSLTRRA